MPLINVKTKPGRKAFTAARGGHQISNEEFVPVEYTHYIKRLIEHHGDLVVEKAPAAKAEVKPAPAPVADTPAKDKG